MRTIYRDIEARAGDVPPSVIEAEARRWVEAEPVTDCRGVLAA